MEAELQVTVVRLKKELDQKERELSEAKETVVRYSAEKMELDAKVQRVTERVQEWNDRREQETETINTLRKGNDELQKLVDDLKATVQINQRTGNELAGLQRQLESYKASNASLLTEVESLRRKVGQQAGVEDLKQEVEALKKTITDNESFLKLAKVAEEEHSETIAAYEAEMKRLQAQAETRPLPTGPNVPSSG